MLWKIPDVVLSPAAIHTGWPQLWEHKASPLKGQVPVLARWGRSPVLPLAATSMKGLSALAGLQEALGCVQASGHTLAPHCSQAGVWPAASHQPGLPCLSLFEAFVSLSPFHLSGGVGSTWGISASCPRAPYGPLGGRVSSRVAWPGLPSKTLQWRGVREKGEVATRHGGEGCHIKSRMPR